MSDELLDDLPEESSPGTGTFHFLGTKLEPFSWDRQAAFLLMRSASLEYSRAVLVFLCMLPIEPCRRIVTDRAFREKMRETFSKWCEANRVTIHNDNLASKECQRIADTVWDDLQKADFDPQAREGQKATPPDPNDFG